MLGMAPFLAFVPVTDLAVARSFYVDVLGLDMTEANEFAVLLDAAGTKLRLTRVEHFQPQPFTIAGWDVADMTAAVEALAGRGVALRRYDGFPQDERGVWTTPRGDQVAWFNDPDGNTLSLTSFASSP